MILQHCGTSLFRSRLAVALACEVLYLVGRTVLVGVIENGLYSEAVLTAWRLVFVVVYASLFFDLVANTTDRQPLPRHPLLIGSIVVSTATLPLVHHGTPFHWGLAALDLVAIPVLALREELFYRAILQNALERVFHPLISVLVASILFTVAHIGAQPMDVATITSILAGGVVLGVVYQYTRNLWLVVALHGIADFLVWLPYTSPLGPSIGFLGNFLAILGALTWWSLDRDRRRLEGR